MGLEKLVGISLEKITPDAVAIKRLLSAAKRNLADAEVEAVSDENRFDAGYKAIMQLANAALQAKGYRTLTSKPGHHMTMIQSLGQSIGLDTRTIIVLDALRKQRHVADYSGDFVPLSAVVECLTEAKELERKVLLWLREQKVIILDDEDLR